MYTSLITFKESFCKNTDLAEIEVNTNPKGPLQNYTTKNNFGCTLYSVWLLLAENYNSEIIGFFVIIFVSNQMNNDKTCKKVMIFVWG